MLEIFKNTLLSCYKGEKVIIFAHHLDVIAKIEEAIKTKNKKKPVKYIKITGATKPEHRTFHVHEFQENPEVRVAIVSVLTWFYGFQNLTPGAQKNDLFSLHNFMEAKEVPKAVFMITRG